MLAILIIILVLIWAAVVWSIYSNFLVFYSNFAESENYHRAYYAAISALERWELVTKQRQPWYVGSGWFKDWEWMWSFSDWWSDKSLESFSYYWDNKEDTTVFWTVNSLTTRIPAVWKWDVEWMLATDDSSDYNMMGYEDTEVFMLYFDKSERNPYEKVRDPYQILKEAPDNSPWNGVFYDVDMPNHKVVVTWVIRLPQLLTGFWLLDTGTVLVWNDGNLPSDDPIVDRQIRWVTVCDDYSTRTGVDPCKYNIYSNQSIKFWDNNKPEVNIDEDTVFRESNINDTLEFEFWNHGRSPFKGGNAGTVGKWKDINRIVADNATVLQGNVWGGNNSRYKADNYSDLFYHHPTHVISSLVQIRFSLLNLLKWNKGIYPFLEYYIDFWWQAVPDKYYTISADWKYKDYDVNIVVQKPTVKESVMWSFTSIF